MAPDKGPVHEVCGDPTAKVDYGLEGQQCNNCVAESVAGYIFDMPIDGMAAAGTKPAGIVGAGAAGADGVLGRCMTYKLTLQKSAVEGEHRQPLLQNHAVCFFVHCINCVTTCTAA